MNAPANSFRTLAAVLPRYPTAQSDACSDMRLSGILRLSSDSVRYNREIDRNPAFGWHAVQLMYRAGRAFPIFPEGKLIWLYRAHLWLQNSDRYDDHPSFHPVIQAVELNSNPSLRGFKALLRALLIADDSTFELIAKALNLPRSTVEAFDSLFFNMMDRRKDFTYLQQVAYPDSRLEEMAEGYLENSNLDQLLLRVAYNEGMATALYIAGMKDNPAGHMSVAELTESLYRDTVLTGYKLAAAGFLKYEKQHPIIRATLELIKAGKSKARAGGDGVTQGGDQESFAEVLQGQLS